MPVLFLGEEQHTGRALYGGRIKAGGADAHHRAAEDDLARGLYEAAALLCNVAERSADAGQAVDRSLEGAAAVCNDTLNNALAFAACLIHGIGRAGADDVAADAGGQPAGLDLSVGDGLDLHLLAALRVLDILGDDLDAVLSGVLGVEKIDSVLLVLLDAVVCLVYAAGNTHKLNTAQQLLREIEHGQMVAVKVRLALCAVDNEGIDLADTAADLDGSREHCAAHADDTRFADALEYCLGVLHLLLSEGLHQLGSILEIVLDDHGHDHVAQRMGSRLNSHYLAGDRSMNGRGDRSGTLADLLIHLHIIAHLDKRLAGCAYVLYHWNDYLCGRCDNGHRDLRSLHVIGVHTAFELIGH